MLINRSNSDVAGGETYTEDGAGGKLLLAGDCDAIVKKMVSDADLADDLRQILPSRHQTFV